MAVHHLEITRRRPYAGGRHFGNTGPYEQIAGVLHFAVAPDDPHNRGIVDLDVAPRNAAGQVEFTADFGLLHPVDGGDARLLFDVLNRGQQRALNVFNDSSGGEPLLDQEMDPGNGFLMRHGYAIAWCGWQQDLPHHRDERMALTGPVLPESVQGLVLCEFQPPAFTDRMLLSDRDHQPYPPADLEDRTATLTVREFTAASRRTIPRDAWDFEPDGHIRLASGFQPGLLYEAVYRARGAVVVGLGLLAARDTVSWLRYGTDTPDIPPASHAYGFGRSQSGRFLRHFLYLGLNEDEDGRTVFDGVIPLVTGARRGEFNLRFGQPSKTLGQGVGALPPFNDHDLIPGGPHRPKVLSVNSSAEYWGGDRGSGGQASLLHTDLGGTTDLEPPEDSRIYLLAGTQHVGVALPPTDATSSGIRGHHAFNCINYNPYLRGALAALDRWVVEGKPAPSSRFPRLSDGTAVPPDFAAAACDALPDVQGPLHLPRLTRMEFGPGLQRGVPERLPPELGDTLPHYVSALDDDGNELAGIRAPEISVPLATYTGWNVRHPDSGAPGEYIPETGATLPFRRSEHEAQQHHDPRVPVHQRYAGEDGYLEQGRAAAEALVADGYILEEDVDRILDRMSRLWGLLA